MIVNFHAVIIPWIIYLTELKYSIINEGTQLPVCRYRQLTSWCLSHITLLQSSQYPTLDLVSPLLWQVSHGVFEDSPQGSVSKSMPASIFLLDHAIKLFKKHHHHNSLVSQQQHLLTGTPHTQFLPLSLYQPSNKAGRTHDRTAASLCRPYFPLLPCSSHTTLSYTWY